MFYKISFDKDGEKTINYISPQVENVLGLTTEEYIKNKNIIFEHFHPDDIKDLKETIKKNSRNKNKWSVTYRFYNKKLKKYVWIEETLHAIFNSNGIKTGLLGTARDISEIKKRENQLAFILENLDECIYSVKFNKGVKKLSYISNKIKNITGLTAKEFEKEGKSGILIKRIHPDDVAMINKHINEGLYDQKKRQLHSVFRFKPKGKTKYLWIEESVYSTYDKDGDISETTTVLRDITKSKTIELYLKENEEKYRNIFTKNLAGVFITEKNKIIECNNSFAKIFGYKSRVQLIGTNPKHLYFNKKDRDVYLQDLNKNKTLTNYRIRHKKNDGSELWISTNVSIKDGRIEGTLVGITEQVKKEELTKEKLRARIAEESNKILQKEINERKLIEKKLIENQKYTSSIINSSLDIICASDVSGNIIEINKSGINTFGYKENELLKSKIKILYSNKSDLIKVSKQLKESGFYVGEVENVRKNGEKFISFLSASTLYDNEGNIIGSMGVSRDITELKEAEKQLIESEEKYRDLFENATDLIQSVSVDGTIVYVNNSWKKTLGYNDKEIENKNIFDFIHPDCKEKCNTIFQEVTKNKTPQTKRVSYELITKEGKKITVEGNVSLKLKNGKPDTTRAILRDITGEIWDKTLQSLYNNIAKIITEKTTAEETYEAIRLELGKVVNTDVFSISYMLDKKTIAFPYYYDKHRGGRIFVEKRNKKKGLNEYIIDQNKPLFIYKEEWGKIIKTEKYKLFGPEAEVFIGIPLKINNIIIGVVALQSYTNKNEYDQKTQQILEFISGALALTVQRKYDENKIQEQSARLKAVIENSSHLFWTYKKGTGLTSFNKNYSDIILDLYGKRPKIETDHKPMPPDIVSFWDDKYNEAKNGKKVDFVIERKNKKGFKRISEVFLSPIFNEEGAVSEISGIAHDITEKTIAEESLKESLKEKEVLLKEVHHRVKNNLQVISSILNLQSSYVKDEKTLNILQESQNRIKSMAFIHESLYQTNDFSKINFSEYLVSLSKNLVHSYGVFDNFVELKLNVGEVSLSLDLSIPCGLLINELISNALKYAFKPNEKGIITIGLKENSGTILLTVADNGIGLPENINYRETESLGLQLVMTLAEQINGTIELDNKNGAKYTIEFKKD
jgi:PAS domain S-box-containing protein